MKYSLIISLLLTAFFISVCDDSTSSEIDPEIIGPWLQVRGVDSAEKTVNSTIMSCIMIAMRT